MSTHKSTYDPIDPTVRRILTWGIPVSLAAAGALSVQGLYELAIHVGWPRAVAWLLPVAVEVYAALSALALFGTDIRYREGRKRAALNAVVAVGLSVALNEAWHLIRAGVLPMDWRVVVAVSAVPPAVVAALIHLALSLPDEVPVPDQVSESDSVVTESSEVSLTRETPPRPAEVLGEGAGQHHAPRPDPVPNGGHAGSVPAPVAAAGRRAIPVPNRRDVPGPSAPGTPVPVSDPAPGTLPDSLPVVTTQPSGKTVPSTSQSLPWRPPRDSVVALKEELAKYPHVRPTSEMLAAALGKSPGWWRRVRRWVEEQEQQEAQRAMA
jgi:hypothetical protein